MVDKLLDRVGSLVAQRVDAPPGSVEANVPPISTTIDAEACPAPPAVQEESTAAPTPEEFCWNDEPREDGAGEPVVPLPATQAPNAAGTAAAEDPEESARSKNLRLMRFRGTLSLAVGFMRDHRRARGDERPLRLLTDDENKKMDAIFRRLQYDESISFETVSFAAFTSFRQAEIPDLATFEAALARHRAMPQYCGMEMKAKLATSKYKQDGLAGFLKASDVAQEIAVGHEREIQQDIYTRLTRLFAEKPGQPMTPGLLMEIFGRLFDPSDLEVWPDSFKYSLVAPQSAMLASAKAYGNDLTDIPLELRLALFDQFVSRPMFEFTLLAVAASACRLNPADAGRMVSFAGLTRGIATQRVEGPADYMDALCQCRVDFMKFCDAMAQFQPASNAS